MAYISFKPSDFFNTLLYTGTSDTWTAHSGLGFQPNFTWHKSRTSTGWNGLCDSVRGVDADPGCKAVYSNDTSAEETSTTEYLDGYQSDGFTVGVNGSFGSNGEDYAAWCWKAGTNSGVDFSSGDITPTGYSINTTSGIGIYHYNCTGANATMVHGLSSAPKMLITKSLGDTSPWAVWHTGMNPTNYLVLNDTAAQATNANAWNSTAPSSTVISFGSDGQTNGSGKNNIMYAFSDVKGYSKFGVYEGTGSASATPYIWTGFRPAYVMIKSYNNVHNWAIYDSKRLGRNADSNQGNASISANVTTIEQKDDDIDIFANGFRPRVTSNQVNGSAWLYAYAAFASNPMVGSNGNPVLGR